MKSVFAIVFLYLISISLSAQTILNSTGSGTWDDASAWDLNRVPASNDIIVIHSGHTIELSNTIALHNVTIRIVGVLKLQSNKSLLLNTSSIVNVLSGGRIMAQSETAATQIRMGTSVKYRANKIFNQNWGTGVVHGLAYATSVSGDVDKSGPGFILGTLPAVWQDFTLYPTQEGDVQMVWVTSHETGSRVFEIQRSRNASDWEIIGTILSAGNLSPENIYSFVDNDPGQGIVYYRVRHVDPDGKYAFSAVRFMKLGFKETGISVYPNPARDMVRVNFDATNGQSVCLTLYNLQGQLVKRIWTPAGVNSFQADLSGLAPGLYILEYRTNDEQVQLARICKQ